MQPISDYKEPSRIPTPGASEKTDMTQSVPISEKGNSDEKAQLFAFPLQTGYSFKGKELFDFGVIELSNASIPELKTTKGEEPFGGSFKGHSNFILDIALSQDYLYSCYGDKTIKKWDLNKSFDIWWSIRSL